MAYTASVTLDTPTAKKIGRRLRVLTGQCNITSYDTTGVEITDITKYFRSIKSVVPDGVSSNGYVIKWDRADKCFHAYYPTKSHNHVSIQVDATATAADQTAFVGLLDGTGAAVSGVSIAHAGGAGSDIAVNSDTLAASAGTEVANGVDVGTFNFVAYGT